MDYTPLIIVGIVLIIILIYTNWFDGNPKFSKEFKEFDEAMLNKNSSLAGKYKAVKHFSIRLKNNIYNKDEIDELILKWLKISHLSVYDSLKQWYLEKGASDIDSYKKLGLAIKEYLENWQKKKNTKFIGYEDVKLYRKINTRIVSLLSEILKINTAVNTKEAKPKKETKIRLTADQKHWLNLVDIRVNAMSFDFIERNYTVDSMGKEHYIEYKDNESKVPENKRKEVALSRVEGLSSIGDYIKIKGSKEQKFHYESSLKGALLYASSIGINVNKKDREIINDIFCPKCGSKQNDNKFCTNCGNKLI